MLAVTIKLGIAKNPLYFIPAEPCLANQVHGPSKGTWFPPRLKFLSKYKFLIYRNIESPSFLKKT